MRYCAECGTKVREGKRLCYWCEKGEERDIDEGEREKRVLPVDRFLARKRNPKHKGVVIYSHVTRIEAIKGAGSMYNGDRFYHDFEDGAKAYGLPDGSILIKGRKPLWDMIEQDEEVIR